MREKKKRDKERRCGIDNLEGKLVSCRDNNDILERTLKTNKKMAKIVLIGDSQRCY